MPHLAVNCRGQAPIKEAVTRRYRVFQRDAIDIDATNQNQIKSLRHFVHTKSRYF